MDNLYMDIAERVSQMSYASRAKVGAVLTSHNNIISYGWNGTPAGDDNTCEYIDDAGALVTKPDVLHAESNLLMKVAAQGGSGAQGATLYVTMSPCAECSKLIKQAGIARVVYRERYRDTRGIDFLLKRGVKVEQLGATAPVPAPQPVTQPAERPKMSLLAGVAGRPAPVQGPTLAQPSPGPKVEGPTLVQPQVPPKVEGPVIEEVDINQLLAQAGVTLVNGVPVERPVAAPATRPQQDDTSYRSSFL